MNSNQRIELLMLLASFSMAYCLFQSAEIVPMPVTVVGALLVIAILIKVARNENVS